MKFSVSSILLTTFIVVLVELNEAHDYGPLIKNISDKYETTGVTILSGTNYPSFEKMKIWHEIVRMLSGEGISALTVNFKQFEEKLKVRNERSARVLIVIAIGTIEELHIFESIAKDLRMKYAIWLIFFARDAHRDVCERCRNPHGSSSIPKLGSKVIISCCGSKMIEQWWHIGQNHIKKQELGRLMDANHGIEWFSDESVNRCRYSMDGQELRIAAVENSFAFRVENGDYYGILGEFLKEVSHAMNFTISKIIWEDGSGAQDTETLNWTGIFGRIHRREVDLGVAGFFMTSERYDMVSFTNSILSGTFQLHYRTHNVPYSKWNAYFMTLTMDVWMVIMSLILMTPLLLTLIEYRRKLQFFPLLSEHCLNVWRIFCQQGLPGFSKELPSRMVYASIFLSALITSTAYSSRIISSLATPSHPLFSTIEELVEDGTYKLIIVKNVPLINLQKPLDQKLSNKVMSLLKPNDSLPQSYQDGFEQVCSERVAFYTHELTKKAFLNVIPCEITSIKVGATTNLAMIMPRGSEYLDILNYHIEQFRANGILRRLEIKYLTELRQDKHELQPVNLQGVASIFVILAVGFFIASIILIIEKHFYYSPTKNSDILLRLRKQNRGKNLKRHFHFP